MCIMYKKKEGTFMNRFRWREKKLRKVLNEEKKIKEKIMSDGR